MQNEEKKRKMSDNHTITASHMYNQRREKERDSSFVFLKSQFVSLGRARAAKRCFMEEK